jgi:hypothetical protein
MKKVICNKGVVHCHDRTHDKLHYKQLVEHAHDCGLKVRKVSSKRILDYAGMNPDAAKVFGYTNIRKKEILIDKNLPHHTVLRNLRHELIEKELMDKGKKYFPAHKLALKREKRKTKWEE